MASKNSPYVVYRGLEQGNKFYSTNTVSEPESEKVKLNDGTVAYEILGYADTPEEARVIIWGRKEPSLSTLVRQNMKELNDRINARKNQE